MSRVKFNVNTEYAYIQNFKVLQSTFCSSCLMADKHIPDVSQTDTSALSQTPSHVMESTDPSPSSSSSNASSKITSNFSSGRRDTGINTFLATNTMLSHEGKRPAQAPLPQHQ